MIDPRSRLKRSIPLAILGLSLISGAALAAPYSTEIVITTEEEINELQRDGDITEEERDTLLTLFLTPLDLNLASRDELYDLPGFTYTLADATIKMREDRGRFFSVSGLMGVEGMTEEVYRQAVVFVTITPPSEDEKKYDAQIRMGAIGRTGVPNNNNRDDPAGYLRTKIRFLNHGGVGFLFAVRPMTTDVGDATLGVYCDSAGKNCRYGASLVGPEEAPAFDPSNFYLYWDGPRWSGIGGSYTLGYGLGLTLDNSGRRKAHGWYENLDFSEDLEKGKVRPFEGFVGLALRHKQIDLPKGHLDISVFGSAWNRDMYVYDTQYDRGQLCPPGEDCSLCPPGSDPKTCPGCPAGKVKNWKTGNCVSINKMPALACQDPVGSTSINGVDVPLFRSLHCDYPTLQGIMRELMAGGNLTYWINRRSHVGFTGYVGNWHMNAEADGFAPSVSSKYPYDRPTWGVWGANTRFGLGRYDFGAEVAVTDQGAVGALAMAWMRPFADFELIPSFRYYGPDFDNPYNRGIHNADEFQGNRARDELGGRLQLDYRPASWLTIKADLNIWYHEYPALKLDRDETDPTVVGYIPDGGFDLSTIDPDPSTDLETSLKLYFRVTSKEKFDVQALFHDEALHRTGHDLSYEFVKDNEASEPVGPDKTDVDNRRKIGWGGSKIAWQVTATTKRIPRTTVSGRFKQTFKDTKNIADGFDQTYYFWFKVATNLSPGPYIMARFKYLDEYTVDDGGWHQASACAQWANQSYSEILGALGNTALPGSCRGETFMDTYLQITQKLPSTMFAGSSISLRANWTHWTDDRGKWEKGYACVKDPSRDEVAVKGYVNVKF